MHISPARFTLGVAWFVVSAAALVAQPRWTAVWYTASLAALLAARLRSHLAGPFKTYVFFLLDFCYPVNLLLASYLWLAPAPHPLAFAALFGAVNGPVAWSTVLWRNQLLFHDIEKVCSCFIHAAPPLVTYALRWHTPGPHRHYGYGWGELVWPAAFYAGWQVLYLLATEVVFAGWLAARPEHMTSLRWMARTSGGAAGGVFLGALKRLGCVLPTRLQRRRGAPAEGAAAKGTKDEDGSEDDADTAANPALAAEAAGVAGLDADALSVKAAFVGSQGLYTAATFALTPALFAHQGLHLVACLGWVAVCVYNGAVAYAAAVVPAPVAPAKKAA